MGAGGSAQEEYERRRGRDRDRRRRTWKRSLLLVVLTFPAVYLLVQLAAWGIYSWAIPRVLHSMDSVGTTTTVLTTLVPRGPAAPETTVTTVPANAPRAAEGTDDAKSVDKPTKLVNQLGLVLAGVATLRMAVSVWGPRQSTEAWGKGAAGERATAAVLDALPAGFVAVHDLPLGRRANVDHVVVGPTGAFTVETKNYQAGVVIKSDRVTRSGRRMDDILEQAKGQAEAMARLVGREVRPIVCVQGGGVEVKGWFQKPVIDGIRFCGGRGLHKALTEGPTMLSPAEVAAAAARLPRPKTSRRRPPEPG